MRASLSTNVGQSIQFQINYTIIRIQWLWTCRQRKDYIIFYSLIQWTCETFWSENKNRLHVWWFGLRTAPNRPVLAPAGSGAWIPGFNRGKKEIFIRDLTIDFNADRNQNEKRFTIGEHNGEEWVRKPKSIILNQARESWPDLYSSERSIRMTSRRRGPMISKKVNKGSSDSPVGEFSSILLNSNAEMSITCYLKLKIEIEEMNWVGASAQKSLMFRYWLLIGRILNQSI